MINFKSILGNWNLVKILRILIGFFIVIDGYKNHEWLLLLLGLGLIAMGFLNMGCGFSGSCAINNECEANQISKKEI